MAGYKPKRRILVLREWPDEDMDGLEVKARSVPTGEFLDFGRMMASVADLKVEDAEKTVTGLLDMFASKLVSWNVEDDDGNPIPPTLESLMELDNDWVQRVIMTWMQAVGGMASPLGQRSTDGETSLVASIPMEPLSPSRAS